MLIVPITDTKYKAVIHTLRHTFATQLAKGDIPIHTIQKLLNHSEIKMTDRYAKFLPSLQVLGWKQLIYWILGVIYGLGLM